ncbi:MAG: rhodanese-like domain-containing protein [Anaerolineae bacterium]
MKRLIVPMLILSALIFSACGQAGTAPATVVGIGKRIEAPGGSYILLSVTELNTMLANKDFTFVNVHIPYEGEIDETDLFISYKEIDQNLVQLPAKDAKIVLYCLIGGMSKEAALALVSLGYTNVYDVEGGMSAWKAAGLPLLRQSN